MSTLTSRVEPARHFPPALKLWRASMYKSHPKSPKKFGVANRFGSAKKFMETTEKILSKIPLIKEQGLVFYIKAKKL